MAFFSSPYGKVDVLYEDDALLCVNKPHGLHTVADRYNVEKVTLKSLLEEAYGDIFVCHRLDAGTGGAMVFAKDPYTHKAVSKQFEYGNVTKKYYALTKGVPFAQSLSLPIAQGSHGKYKINFKSGKKAVTSFLPVITVPGAAIVQALPHTGRTHQIRVHLKALKTPLYHDWLYNIKSDDRRVTLFAYELTFVDPSGGNMTVTAPVSDFMKEQSKAAGFYLTNSIF